MAAFRNGIRTVLIPADNAKDLEEIDQTVRAALQFILVERADQVLANALVQSAGPVRGEEEPVNHQEPALLPRVDGHAGPVLRQ